jgi:predicted ATPase
METVNPNLWVRSGRLECFKAAFRPAPIPLERFTVIVGRNGAGKSTLLEALQWLDVTMRHDARRACARYFGMHDMVNLRSRTLPPYFQIGVEWDGDELTDGTWSYDVRVEESDAAGTPRIALERLSSVSRESGKPTHWWIVASAGDEPGVREVYPQDDDLRFSFDEPDRLALSRGGHRKSARGNSESPFQALASFWDRAVFLRLSPNRLMGGSTPKRPSFEPLLDEEGQTLAALIAELDADAREHLVHEIQRVLPDMRDVVVDKPLPGRETQINYYLKERMPYRGRTGRHILPVPAWMLSEGTRRITAVFALLSHDPPPSLLCIEEVENGLDPWTVEKVLNALQSAVDAGTQVIVTTHSPWLLNMVPLASILHVRRHEGETVYERFATRQLANRFAASVPPGTRYVSEPQ